MNGVLGFVDLLGKSDLEQHDRIRYTQIIKRSGHRLLDTINDLIDISRIEAGQIKIKYQSISLKQTLDELIAFFKPQSEEKGLELKYFCELPPELDSFITDDILLYGILSNLIKNAIKYTKKGFVELGCRTKDETKKIIFYVKDSGIGIPPNRQKAIFNRFEQADIEDRGAMEGSGLGLSIALGYARLLHGEIKLESQENVGSTFTLILPIKEKYQDLKKSDLPKTKKVKKDNPMQNKNILIAEDDEANRLFLSTILKDKFAHIYLAHNGLEAVELMDQEKNIDVILMDIKMPKMNGYEASKIIKSKYPIVKIIAQTAYALEGDKEKALAHGCDAYIAKPFRPEQLMEVIEA